MRKKTPVLITTLALFFSFAIAFIYEKSILRLIQHYKEAFAMAPFWELYVSSSLAPFLVLLLILALAWLGLWYLPPSRFAAALWIFFGLFIIALYLHPFIIIGLFPDGVAFPAWFRPPSFLGRLRSDFMYIGGRRDYAPSIFYLACGSTLIGIAAFIRYGKEKRRGPQIEYGDQNAERTGPG